MHDIKFERHTHYKGRNGTGICTGISTWFHKEDKILEIIPMNTKGYAAGCRINIPLESLVGLVPKELRPLLIGLSPEIDCILDNKIRSKE